jgi:hypothetical protein
LEERRDKNENRLLLLTKCNAGIDGEIAARGKTDTSMSMLNDGDKVNHED